MLGFSTAVDRSKVDQHVLHRQFLRARLPRIVRRFNSVPVDQVRHPFTDHYGWRVCNFEMQMRFSGVSGTADFCENLSPPHALSRLYAQRTRLQVKVVRELSFTYVKGDDIAGKRFHRYRYSRLKFLVVAGHILRDTVSHFNYFAISDRQNWLAIRIVRALIECVARKRRSILALLPIDCVASRTKATPIEDGDAAPVMVVFIVTRAV